MSLIYASHFALCLAFLSLLQGMNVEGKGSLRIESSFATLERSIRRESIVDSERALEQHREAKRGGSDYQKICAVKQV
jgi:hypothetical protein